MSMLSSQADELRKMADELRNANVDDSSVGLLFAAMGAMREAADTIESLRDKLQPVPAELDYIEDKSRWHELFGTPERAARTLEELELDQLNWCRGTEYCEKCPYEFDRYGCYPPDGFSLLEWLRGDA